jgi:hypothetical protein
VNQRDKRSLESSQQDNSDDSINLPFNLSTETDEEIKRIVNEKRTTLRDALRYKEIKETKLFTIKTVEGRRKVYLPRNLNELIDDPAWAAIIQLILTLDADFKLSDEVVERKPLTKQSQLFWAGFCNRLVRPWPQGSISFTANTPQDKGKVAADIELILHSIRIVGLNFFTFIPNGAKTLSGGKILNLELSAMGGASGMKALGGLENLIHEVVKKYISNYDLSKNFTETLADLKVPYGVTIANLQRTKTVTKGTKKVLSVISLVRPSQKIEMITSVEKSIAKTLEGPWNALADLARKYSKGVPLTDILSVREKFKEFQIKQFEVNSKLNSWTSRRRATLISVLQSRTGKKKVELTARVIPSLVEYIIDEWNTSEKPEPELLGWLENLSPYHLTEAIGGDKVYWTATKSRWILTGMPDKLKSYYLTQDCTALMEYFSELGLEAPNMEVLITSTIPQPRISKGKETENRFSPLREDSDSE